ncbi:MAG: tetratricopeptide repeat protein [Bacteroidetes bacterium]|nr:tetratricopeptide repeat protein [Bacteroidota bacterium]
MKKIFIFFFLAFTQKFCFSQNRIMDSLKTELQNARQDTTLLRLFLALGEACEIKNNMLYAEPAVELADKLLSQNIDEKQRKIILEQKSRAYDLIIVFYTKNNNTDWNKVIEFIQARLAGYEKEGNKRRIGEALLDISYLYFYKSDTAGYLEYTNKSLAVFFEIKDTVFLLNGYWGLSQYFLSIGNYQQALKSIQSAIEISKEMNYKKGEAFSLAQLGDMYRDNGENAQALENYQNSLSILNETKDTNDLFNVLAAVGGFYYTLHNVDKALEYYNKLIAICNSKKDIDHTIGSVYKWIGLVHRDNNDFRNSLLYFEKSLAVFDSTKNKGQVIDVLNETGTVYYMQGDFVKAIECHLKSLKIAEELPAENEIARCHHLLAKDYFGKKNYRTAKEYSHRAIAVLEKQIDIKQRSEAELLASQIDSASGNGTDAYEHYKQYVLLSNKLKGDEIHKAAQKEKFQNESDKQKAEQEKKDAVAKAELQKQKFVRNGFIGGFAAMVLFAGIFFAQRNKIRKGKKRSDELLLNILPEEVAEELKAKGSAEAKQFDEVTVMFTDFKGFTQISEKLSAQELVAEIHTCFKAFDNIISKHNIEKIKTIGDSYMCAGGLPVINKTNATDVVKAALEIQHFMKLHSEHRIIEGKDLFEIRIGIHTGPVVAGIVGVRKFAYDIWGDTVNIASRMESSGEAGKVNISGSTYELVKEKFNCAHRGKIQAKNKGEIDMYFVEIVS